VLQFYQQLSQNMLPAMMKFLSTGADNGGFDSTLHVALLMLKWPQYKPFWIF